MGFQISDGLRRSGFNLTKYLVWDAAFYLAELGVDDSLRLAEGAPNVFGEDLEEESIARIFIGIMFDLITLPYSPGRGDPALALSKFAANYRVLKNAPAAERLRTAYERTRAELQHSGIIRAHVGGPTERSTDSMRSARGLEVI